MGAKELVNHVNETADKMFKAVEDLSLQANSLSLKLKELAAANFHETAASNDMFMNAFTVFILACFVGYYVVWKVTPALHTPLMSVTNAISGIIIVGAMIAAGPATITWSKLYGFLAVVIASVNIFGGFAVTYRMLEMFRKK